MLHKLCADGKAPMDVSFPSLMLSPVWLVVAITVGYLFARAVYNVFFHPLAKVPGPFLASLTTKWIDIHDIAGCKALTVAPIHERFGPVVRIGPDELSFSDPALLKEIYGQATPYMKSALYSHLGVGTHDGIFDTQDREVHKRRRKLLSHVFAASSVNTCEPIIADHIRRLLSWIEKDSKMVPPQPTDVFIWFRMLSFDIAGSLFFGASFNALSSPTPPAYLDSLDAHFQGAGIRWHMPYVLSLTSWLPIPSWQHFLKASERLHAYGQTAFHDYVSRYGRDGSNSRVDLLKKVIAGTDSKEVAPLTDEEIICEAGTMIIGGTDTTSIVLTYLFWELARHPVWQDKLRDEFRANNVVFKDGVPSWQQVQSLEILDAVITEGLRLHPPAPGGLLRVVPKEGAELAGVRVPGGVSLISLMCDLPSSSNSNT